MGTETIVFFDVQYITSRLSVKLNNPLMGTETDVDTIYFSYDENDRVKLNNPLMGTETVYHCRCFHRQEARKLN